MAALVNGLEQGYVSYAKRKLEEVESVLDHLAQVKAMIKKATETVEKKQHSKWMISYCL